MVGYVLLSRYLLHFLIKALTSGLEKLHVFALITITIIQVQVIVIQLEFQLP